MKNALPVRVVLPVALGIIAAVLLLSGALRGTASGRNPAAHLTPARGSSASLKLGLANTLATARGAEECAHRATGSYSASLATLNNLSGDRLVPQAASSGVQLTLSTGPKDQSYVVLGVRQGFEDFIASSPSFEDSGLDNVACRGSAQHLRTLMLNG